MYEFFRTEVRWIRRVVTLKLFTLEGKRVARGIIIRADREFTFLFKGTKIVVEKSSRIRHYVLLYQIHSIDKKNVFKWVL